MISSFLLLPAASVQAAPKDFTLNDLLGVMDLSVLAFAKVMIVALIGGLVGIAVLSGIASGLINFGKLGFSAGNNNEMRAASGLKGVKMSALAIAGSLGVTTFAYLAWQFMSGLSKLAS